MTVTCSTLAPQSTEHGIDRGMLMTRDPILWYAEIPLYESEMDDNGVCQVCSSKRGAEQRASGCCQKRATACARKPGDFSRVCYKMASLERGNSVE